MELNFSPEMLEDPKIQQALKDAGELAAEALKQNGLDQDPVLQRVMGGETIAQARGLSREDLEIIYGMGFTLITSGELDKAEDVFITLCFMDQLVAKNHYCLGVVRQMKQQWQMACDDFIRFLALDATNPEGYLRIGECKVALGEKDEAKEYFRLALLEAEQGNGPDDAVEQAQAALALFEKET